MSSIDASGNAKTVIGGHKSRTSALLLLLHMRTFVALILFSLSPSPYSSLLYTFLCSSFSYIYFRFFPHQL